MIQAALAALASIPLIGGSVAALATTFSISPADAKLLRDTRDLLLPGLCGVRGEYDKLNPQLELNITIDYETRNLLVVGYNGANNNMLGFCITRESIRDGRVKAEFRPSVQTLCRILTGHYPLEMAYTTTPEELRKYGFMVA